MEKPWITSGIIRSIKTKSQYLKLNKLRLIDDRVNKILKNILTKIIRRAKNVYFDIRYENSGVII